MNQNLKKFTKVIKVPEKYKVNSPQGWVSMKNIMQTEPYYVWYIELENGDNLKAADEHIVYVLKEGEKESIWIKDLKLNDLVETDTGYHKCIKVENLNYQENMYDIEVDTEEHQYYTNNVTSHNTTCSSIYLLWFAIFNSEKTVAILANKQRTAKSIVDDIKVAYKELPDWMKPGVTKWDALNLEFDNESKVFASATSEDALRGESISLLFLDEFAFVPENVADAFWSANLPTISTGGSIIVVSTPNGTAGLFYELYQKAGHDSSPWERMRVRWDQHPDRDETWKEDMLSSIGKVRFNAEFNCSFSGSTYTLIEGDILESLRGIDPILIPQEGFYIWKKPEPNRLYMFGVDPAKGANNDYHVINIYDVTTWHLNGKYEQVGLFRRNDISLFDFEAVVLDTSKRYNNPVIIVENNHLGSVLVNNLYFEHAYEETFYDYDKGEYGINANIKTKPLALVYFKEDIETGKQIINSEDMIRELNYFEEIRTGIFRAREGRGFHDDTVSAGYWVSYALRSRYYEDYLSYLLKNSHDTYVNPDDSQDEDILDMFTKNLNKGDEEQFFRNELFL